MAKPTPKEKQVAMEKLLRVMNWNADVAALNIRQFFSVRESKKLDDLSSLLSRPSSQVLFLSSLDSAMIAIRIKEQRT